MFRYCTRIHVEQQNGYKFHRKKIIRFVCIYKIINSWIHYKADDNDL